MSDGLTAEELAAYQADTETEAEDGNILAKITRIAKEAREAEADVVRCEEQLKAAQGRVRNLKEFVLPELMAEAKQERLKTQDGYELEVKETLRASIPAQNLPQAILWLTANQQSGIIKREIKLAFGKDEDQKAAETLDTLLEHGLTPADKQFVHPQTLAATIRELLENGVDVPLELLGAHVQKGVTIKEAKKK